MLKIVFGSFPTINWSDVCEVGSEGGGGVGRGSVCSIRLALPVQREARNPTSCLDYLVLLADQAN